MSQSVKNWPPSMRPSKTPAEDSVGIVIPVKDGMKFFKLAFHSLLNFTDHPWALTIVENMCSFSTTNYLRQIQRNHDITVTPYQDEFNYAAEINFGIRAMFKNSSVKYGMALNSDIVAEPFWLSRMLRVLGGNPDVGIVGPVTNTAIPAQEQRRSMLSREVDYVSGFCMLFKREVFEKLDGFDEGYKGGCYEDQDFCLRAKREGWKTMVAAPVHIHHFWKATRRHDPEREEQVAKNRERFYSKFPKPEEAIAV